MRSMLIKFFMLIIFTGDNLGTNRFFFLYQRKNVQLAKSRCGSKVFEIATSYGDTTIPRSLTTPVWHKSQPMLILTTCGRLAQTTTTAMTIHTCTKPFTCARYTFVIFGFKWAITKRWQIIWNKKFVQYERGTWGVTW